MGLFSSKKRTSQKNDIPEDILADVSVNGEKKMEPPKVFSVTSSAEAPATASSPFLRSKPSTEQAPDTLPVAPVANKATPKPFQFSNQAPSEIQFTDTPEASKESLPSTSERPDFSQITQDKALTEKQKEHLSPLKPKPLPAPINKKSLWSAANIVSLSVFILILALISGGSWYYLNTRVSVEEAPEASIGELPNGEISEGTEETESTILLDQPNYLIIDVETVTMAQIKELLENEGQKMKTEGVTVPVEYLVVDGNSNPVAFARFAFLIGADTPSDLVEASLEPFSLYLFLDQGQLRTALAVTLGPETGPNFPANKTVLPESLKKFFYPEEYSTVNFSTLSFSESNYKNTRISYANIDAQKNLSFDITHQEGILTLANSKEALRAVIDKRLLIPEE